MANLAKYTIFKTKWGYFGLAADKKGLLRTVLPCPALKITERHLLTGLDSPQLDKNLLKPLQKQIITYFKGRPQSSARRGEAQRRRAFCPLNLSGLSPFTRKVLAACRKIPPGKTISYSQLAAITGNPRASRAVGNALAKNPIPLIIPCHRVIRSDGSPGQFSAPGGKKMKRNLINLEKS